MKSLESRSTIIAHHSPKQRTEKSEYQNDLVCIGKKLIELRKSKGYSSHLTFADVYDLPRVQYWRMEKGRSNFTIRSLARILAIHHLTIEQFFASLQVKDGQKQT